MTQPPLRAVRADGFSVLELLVAMAVLVVLTGPIFTLVDQGQQRHSSEADFLQAVQNARVGVDQLVREIRNAGYPHPFTYTATPGIFSSASPDLQRRFAIAFPGTPSQTCTLGGTCTVPNGFQLTMQMDVDPTNSLCPGQVESVDYSLVHDPVPAVTSTLLRRVQSKAPIASAAGCLPAAANFVPFVENVLNDPSNPADPVFTYQCSGGCTPDNVQSVGINLRVRSLRPDPKTGQLRVITVSGWAGKVNPAK